MCAWSSNALWNGFSKISGFLLCCRGTGSTLLMLSPKTHLPVYWESGQLAGQVSHPALPAPGNIPGKLRRLWKKKIQLLFCATEKIELSWEPKHLNESFRNANQNLLQEYFEVWGEIPVSEGRIPKSWSLLKKIHFCLKIINWDESYSAS